MKKNKMYKNFLIIIIEYFRRISNKLKEINRKIRI